MKVEPLVAVALAGGGLEEDFRRAGYDAPNKAYIQIGNMTMLERVLRALRAAPSIEHVRCVTPVDVFAQTFGERSAELCDAVFSPGADVIESFLAGCIGLAPDSVVLVSATDIPLATGAAVERFVTRALEIDWDLGYGFVSRRAHNRQFPHIRHTWVRLLEGTYCGAGVSMVRIGAAAQIADLLRRVVAARKSPLKLAALFSPLLVFRLLLGRVSIEEVERRASRIAGLRCRGILCDDPELAVNVDCVADLNALKAILEKIETQR